MTVNILNDCDKVISVAMHPLARFMLAVSNHLSYTVVKFHWLKNCI